MPTPISRQSAEQFKKGIAAGTAPAAETVLVKDFAPEIIKDIDGPESRVVQFVISTGAVDRDGDTIDPQGWDLNSFQKSGAVLWGHDASQLPIAESLACWVEDGKLKARCRFPSKDVYAFADCVYNLIKQNVLRCTSVGFKPTKWVESDRKDETQFFPGLDFKTQTLLEYSVVSVPANPEALVEAKRLGTDLGPYLEWATKTLDTLHDSGLLVSRNALEKTYFAAKGSVSVPVPRGSDMPDKTEQAPIAKGGRVLSKKNETRLFEAVKQLQEIIDDHAKAAAPDSEDDDEQEPDEDDKPAKDSDVVSVKALTDAIAGKQNDSISVDSIRGVLAELVDGALRRAQGK